jgi:hypothetical protein
MPRKKKTAPKPAPKPARKPRPGRRPKNTPDWAPKFLEAVMMGLHVRDACKAARVNPGQPYDRRKTDEAFKLAWADAAELGEQELMQEAGRRAFHGVKKPLLWKGKIVVWVREYSDQLIMFLLRSKNPQKYRDNSRFEHSGPNGGPIQVSHADARTVHTVDPDEFRRLPVAEMLRVIQQSLDAPSPN